MGRESGDARAGSEVHDLGAARGSPRSNEDEGVGEGIGLVARVGWYGGERGERLSGTSGSSSTTRNTTDATVELADSPMKQTAY